MQAVAKITKNFDNDGAVVVRLYEQWDDAMADDVLFVDIDGLSVPVYIYGIRRRGQNGAVVRIEDVDTIKRAEMLLGRELMSSDAVAPDLKRNNTIPRSVKGNLKEPQTMVGWSVSFEGRAETGVITDFFDEGNNPLFEVEIAGGNKILIPSAPQMIASIKDENIRFELPEGLIELYD